MDKVEETVQEIGGVVTDPARGIGGYLSETLGLNESQTLILQM